MKKEVLEEIYQTIRHNPHLSVKELMLQFNITYKEAKSFIEKANKRELVK